LPLYLARHKETNQLMERRLGVSPVLDLVGAGSALLCTVHCAATGVFIAVLPIVGIGAMLNERTELAFLVIAITLGVVSLGIGWRSHRRIGPLCLLGVGMFMLLAVRPQLTEGTAAELGVVLFGGCSLVSAHWQNHRLMRESHVKRAGSDNASLLYSETEPGVARSSAPAA